MYARGWPTTAWLARVLFGSMLAANVSAGDVSIRQATFTAVSPGQWDVQVTLEHGDTGWEHYADAWRIVAADGTVFGVRTLYHPHENEQPFTRGLSVAIPATVVQVIVEAHDKVHGWTPNRLKVDLNKAIDGHLRVE